jgi:hypothetical protein
LHAARKIEKRKEKKRCFARSRDASFLRGHEASGELGPIRDGQFGAQQLQGLRGGNRGTAFEVEECGGVRTQRTERSGDQKTELFFAEAACNVGGAEAKNQVEQLLAELANFCITGDGESSERIFAKKNGSTTPNIGELGCEGTSGMRNFILQEKHRMELESGLSDVERLAKLVGLGLMERGEDENEIQVGSGVEFAFGGAAEEHHGKKVGAESILCGLQKRIQNLGERRRELRQRKWRGGTHERPHASRDWCWDDARTRPV